MVAKETKQLNKAYNNRLNFIQKSIFTDKTAGLMLFVEYLKYLRDLLVLNEYNKDNNNCR